MLSLRRRALSAVTCTALALAFVVALPSLNAGATTTTPVASPVSVGFGQVCATVASGADECYGLDTNGQLGYFYGNLASSPSDAGSINNASATSAGDDSTCAVLFSGGVDCWGNDQYGQLGNGETEQYSISPVAVIGITTATSVSMGDDFACATLADGSVDCWGNGNSGDLGDSESTQETSPVQVPGISDAVQVTAGYDFACALLSTGSIDCWGDNTSDALGTSTDFTPEFVNSTGSITNATQVSAGQDGVCALLSTGSIDCWGANTDGDLGDDSGIPSIAPMTVSGISTATSVSMGDDFACAVVSATAECWGDGGSGQLGNGLDDNSDVPVDVSSLSNLTAVSADLGACAVVSPGAVWCWGTNNWDELGTFSGGSSDTPVLINGLDAVTPEPTYTVNFNAEGGTSESSGNYTVGSSALTLPTPALTGYSFAGWYTAPSGGTLVTSPYSPSASITLYAQWTPDVYTVSFNAEGGAAASSLNFTVGGSALTLPTTSETGYGFNGWYTAPTGGTLVSSPYVPSASTTLYAQWTPNAYTVAFNAEGGLAESSLNYTVGDAGLTLPTTSETGYGFSGWYTAPTGGTLVSSPYSPTASMTLYAQWTADVYIVTFNATGGTVNPATEPFTVGAGGVSLPAASRADYAFKGWFTAASGGTIVSSPYTPTGSTTLYAQWQRVTYNVTLNPEGGSVTPSSESYSAGGAPLTLPTPTYTGYTFLGWFTSPTSGSPESSTFTPTSTTTLYAQWKAGAYVVSYDATGGQVSPANSTFTIGGDPITLVTPARAGYSFVGWYSAATGGSLESSPYTPTASLTLYARWKVGAPGKPSALTISRSGNILTVRWTSVDNASHYVCTLSRGSSSIRVASSTTTTKHCSFTVPALRSSYRVSVVATNAAGTSNASVATLAAGVTTARTAHRS